MYADTEWISVYMHIPVIHKFVGKWTMELDVTNLELLDSFFIKNLLLLALNLNQFLINKKGFGFPPLFLRGITSGIGTPEYMLWSKTRNLVVCGLRTERTVQSSKS